MTPPRRCSGAGPPPADGGVFLFAAAAWPAAARTTPVRGSWFYHRHYPLYRID